MRALIIVIALGLVGFMIFGNNPVREFQNNQRVMMEKYGSDEITAQTNMYLEKQQQQNAAQAITPGTVVSLTPYGEPKAEPNANDMRDAIRNSARIVGNDPSFRTRGIYVAPPSADMKEDSSNDLIIQENRLPGQNSANPYQSDYYPPIVGNTPSTDEKPTGREPKLRSGQPVVYEGMAVYSIDPTGKRTLLPDGAYTLENGTRFTINEGRRTF